MKYGLLVWCLVLFLSVANYADETGIPDINVTNVNIKGGFGFSLGDDSTGVELDKDKYTKCPMPFGNFTRCGLEVTPDKKIYMIWSEARYSTPAETQAEFERILNLLEKKYKCKFSNFPAPDIERAQATKMVRIQSSIGHKLITLICYKHTLRLTYYDNDLRLAEQAKMLEEQRKINNNIDAL